MLDFLHVRRVSCTGILKVQDDTSELVQLGMLQQPLSLTGRSDCGVLKYPGLSTLGNWRTQTPSPYQWSYAECSSRSRTRLNRRHSRLFEQTADLVYNFIEL
jgi:hypothetical protein